MTNHTTKYSWEPRRVHLRFAHAPWVTSASLTRLGLARQVSHAPRQLWPRDATAAPRQLAPLDLECLGDQQAIERLQSLGGVRARLLRHQRRYDRIMGRMLTRLQVRDKRHTAISSWHAALL